MQNTTQHLSAAPLLQIRGLEKRFGAVQALIGVDLDVPLGQVTALVGDNGAGKSVLVKSIAGIHEADGGEIRWQGEAVRIRSPRDSAQLGIEVVYQDLALCDNLDVVQNMFLGRERLYGRLLNEDAMEREAAETLSSLRVTTLRSIRQPVASLSGGQRQSIAVAKAVMWNSKLVILDEPTAALGVAQTGQVLELVRRLADQGLAVLMISHNLNDVFAVADRIAVLRLGQMVGEGPAKSFDTQRVVELMTTGQSDHLVTANATSSAAPSIAVENAKRQASQAHAAAVIGNTEADTLGNYLKAVWAKVLAGQSGVLPVLLGMILIAAIFQSQNDKFLSSGNLVNLLVQGAVFMLIGMGEVFILILGEIDLSLGFVAGIGATVATVLVQPSVGWNWPSAVIAALCVSGALGALQGILITRLRLPSFVVTLSGLLGFQGLMIQLLGTGGTIPINSEVINNFANGTLTPQVGWVVTIAIILIFSVSTLRRDSLRRASGLVAPPAGLSWLKIAAAILAGLVLMLISNADRGIPRFPINGMPWVIPIVFVVLCAWAVLLGKLRFGRYLYAIGGNAEAARRAGINLAKIRLLAFTLAAVTAGIGGIIYASRLRSISTSFDGGTIVLYVVATAVIGGTSLFGGRGHPLHAVLGGVVIAAIVNGMALLGLPAAVQLMATAVVLLAAITVDVVVRRRGETSR
ncbi:ATP-binding cassette domain-containing protein [Pectobacteriaceae bacterium CE90]|nr:ATP-binding cassette domain-containing protein [Prodigiosinella sp. LS101]WJV53014.1 ATP-binding cassette domain-containing protein [Prodigiosinella sp. LS101]WJV57369.1 ATP-binding cassette domain-containing protein [Pectobacteriaceae bacterium C111]WJY15959.1 ATP-binding cassette domain-containing protein [Pectobacteriaceae bacterium CE90]